MNINKILAISFVVLLLSSYETDSSFLLGLVMKLLMLKGVLFMGMPLGIGAFVMGQGMGFFAGGMTGSYMMLRASHSKLS
ncbi:unnamed protein product [Orchesella dallaii]|uniref:Uncharacterized protein n=1 Tax=Orchesella dallaii TaxID=48710 RepID=A0ABP1Q6I3_9HEXA